MERKNFLRGITTTPVATRRLLTSICGILLVASIILTNSSFSLGEQNQNDAGHQLSITFKTALLILNVIFLLIFLASTLALIKKEDNDENQSSF